MAKIGAILARASREIQEMESQINDLRDDAVKYGYVIPEKYVFQEHITGMDKFDKDERQSLANLKSAIEHNKDISVCFIWEATRLSRNPFYLVEQLRWFLEHKIPIYIHDWECWTMDRDTLTENNDTTNKVFGYATYGQSEWEKIRKRTMRGRNEKAKQGLYVGHLSDGYKVEIKGGEKHIKIDEERAAVIREIFDMYTVEGLSTEKIARNLNERNILTFSALEAEVNIKNKKVSQSIKRKNTKISIPKSEIKWSGSMVSQVLKNEWYIGNRSYNGVTYQIDPIIDVEQFEAAKQGLKSRTKNKPRRRDNVYPLRGLLICGKCGSLMYGHKVRINSSYYCASLETGEKCGAEGICKQNIDGIVWEILSAEIRDRSYEENGQEKLIELFGLSNTTKQQIESDLIALQNQIDLKEAQVNDLSNALVDLADKMSRTKVEVLYKKLDEKYKKNEREVNSSDRELKRLITQRKHLQRLLDNSENINQTISNRVAEISKTNDIATISDIIHSLIKRVILYNVEASWKLIEVVFLSEESRLVLYNSRKIKNCFVPIEISSITYNDSNHTFEQPNDLLLYFTMYKGTPARVPIAQTFNSDRQEQIDAMIETSKALGVPYLTQSATVEELFAFFKQRMKRIERIESEPKDEEYLSWKSDYKKWEKKRTEKRSKERQAKKKQKEEALMIATEGCLNVRECAKKEGVKVGVIWNAIRGGKLLATKINNRVYVKETDLESYKQTKDAPQNYMVPQDVMKALQLSEWRVREDLKHGVLDATKHKQFYFISKEQFEAYKKRIGK